MGKELKAPVIYEIQYNHDTASKLDSSKQYIVKSS